VAYDYSCWIYEGLKRNRAAITLAGDLHGDPFG
jgi:hypothetical protein